MKLLLLTILTLGVVVGLTTLALENPGYVVLTHAAYTVRLPLALFVLLGLLAFITLYLLLSCFGAIFTAPKKVRLWYKRRNQCHAQTHTMQGYAGLIAGNWSQAENELLRKIQHNQSPLLNYLGAAYAAQQQDNRHHRDQYLAEALAHHPQNWLAIKLTAARLHYQAEELVDSREVLEKLIQLAPNNVAAVRLLADVYRALEDWPSLLALLPVVARLKVFSASQLTAWETQVYEKHMSACALLHGSDALPEKAFDALPADKKRSPLVIAAYCKQLIASGQHELAEKRLRTELNQKWDAEFAYLYGKAEVNCDSQQINLVESWAKKYGSHVDLSLTLARLFRRNGQLDNAKELLKQVVADGGREEARAELATLLEEMGYTEAALTCYRSLVARTGRAHDGTVSARRSIEGTAAASLQVIPGATN